MSAEMRIPARPAARATAPGDSAVADCGHHGCLHERTENILTLANAVTW